MYYVGYYQPIAIGEQRNRCPEVFSSCLLMISSEYLNTKTLKCPWLLNNAIG